MIDRKARNKLAELLRSLASGAISNDEFEDSLPKSSDKAIAEVFLNGGWLLYSDMYEHKLKGKKSLDAIVKKDIAKWVLFLKSDHEYLWPQVSFLSHVLYFFSLGKFGSSREKAWRAAGDIEAWPFLSNSDFESAKNGTAYLQN